MTTMGKNRLPAGTSMGSIAVLLADDDLLTLNKLRSLIPWDEMGYRLAGAARNGEEALTLAESLRPDIMLLDVDMPKISGVELSAILRERLPACKVIMLSNYDSYGYVREAMRNGACDYLLKQDLSPDLLKGKLKEVSRQIRRDGVERDKREYFSVRAKEQFFRRLLTGPPPEEDEREIMADQREFMGVCAVGSLQVSNFVLLRNAGDKERDGRLSRLVTDMAENIFSVTKNGLIADLGGGEFAVLFSFYRQVSQARIMEETASFMNLLAMNLKKLLDFNVIHSERISWKGLPGIREAYRDARTDLESVSFVPKASDREKALRLVDPADEAALIEALCRHDGNAVNSLLDSIMNSAPSGPKEQGLAAQALLETGSRVCAKFDIPEPAIPISAEPRESLADFFRGIVDGIRAKSLEGFSPPVRTVAAYIREHFAEDVTLSHMAAMTGLTESYLSKRFRKEVGATFVDYLNTRRVEAAKSYLDQGMSLKEVCGMAGFHNYNYFIRVFREKTGSTPARWQY